MMSAGEAIERGLFVYCCKKFYFHIKKILEQRTHHFVADRFQCSMALIKPCQIFKMERFGKIINGF